MCLKIKNNTERNGKEIQTGRTQRIYTFLETAAKPMLVNLTP